MVNDELTEVKILYNESEIKLIEDKWDKFVHETSTNPLFFSRFVASRFNLHRSNGWHPLIILISNDVGLKLLAPLRKKKEFGVKYCKLLLQPDFSPDILIEDAHRESYIKKLLNMLFNEMNFNYIDFTIPVFSPNASVIKKICKELNYNYVEHEGNFHRVLPIKCGWDEYYSGLHGKDRKNLRYMHNKINRMGGWRVIKYSDLEITPEIYDYIYDIEKKSWKQKRRNKRHVDYDTDLGSIWSSYNPLEKSYPDFNMSIYFLTFNDHRIAYNLVLTHNKESIIIKTSYDEDYKRISPGKWLMHNTIMDLFNGGKHTNIEFLTNLFFLDDWTKNVEPRIRIVVSKSLVILKLVEYLTTNYVINEVSFSEFLKIFSDKEVRLKIMEKIFANGE